VTLFLSQSFHKTRSIQSNKKKALENETPPCAAADDSMMPPITKPFPTQHSTHHLTQQNVARIHAHGRGTDPRLADMEMELALQPPPDNNVIAYVRSVITSSLHLITDIPMEEIVAFVQSIMASDLNPICPKFWHHAMKDLVWKGSWIEAMFKHLDSCYAIGTFGPPKIPPSNVTVLPAVIVLKMIVNAVKQINAHKVRICAHGGHQVQGWDFEESFAHTVLSQSIKIAVAIASFLGWIIFHFDIHNAFQTCPNESPEGKRTWLSINQTWLDYYRERYPSKWPDIELLLKQGHRPEQFALEMFMFV
jgi:Reverse transcriptase (RNA-dependent DNA polymerase)